MKSSSYYCNMKNFIVILTLFMLFILHFVPLFIHYIFNDVTGWSYGYIALFVLDLLYSDYILIPHLKNGK